MQFFICYIVGPVVWMCRRMGIQDRVSWSRWGRKGGALDALAAGAATRSPTVVSVCRSETWL